MGDTNEPGSSGSPGSLSYQPFLGLVRKKGDSHFGKWHDFHGQDQGTNGREASVGQLAVCQSRPKYWLTGAIKSTDLGHGDAKNEGGTGSRLYVSTRTTKRYINSMGGELCM